MKHSIIKVKSLFKILAVSVFWLALWQIASIIVGEELFFSSPIAVFRSLWQMLSEKSFYAALGNSFLRITVGFLISVVAGIIMAVISYLFPLLKTIFYPIASIMKATPVVSFIILALIIFGSKNLATPISFIMVLPIIYTNTLTGIENTESDLLEMASVFNVSLTRKLKYIILPSVMPFFISGSAIAIGMCWKSGVAAEVIGLSANSLGKKIYESKIYLDIPELFAYTLVIICVSVLFEKLFLFLMKKITKSIETGGDLNG